MQTFLPFLSLVAISALGVFAGGCTISRPQRPLPDHELAGASSLVDRDELIVAAFRQMCSFVPFQSSVESIEGHRNTNCFVCIKFNFGPSPSLAARMTTAGISLLPYHSGVWRDRAIYDRKSGEPGVGFFINRIQMNSDMEAYVDANIVPSNIGANSFQSTNFWMTKFEGQWFATGKMPQILHYDRDHDNVFEEFRRGSVVSFDRNRDGLVDFIVHEEHSIDVLVWDEDFDGFFDKTISSLKYTKHEWSPLQYISVRAPPFPKPRPETEFSPREKSAPDHSYWEALLEIPKAQ